MRRIILPIMLTLCGCTLTPELIKPAPPVPAAFPDGPSESHAATAGDIPWRTMLRDPRLRRLIELALENNRDLRVAILNVQAVQAQYRIQNADLLPGIEASGGVTRQRTAANNETTPAQPSTVNEQVGVNIGLSAFEVDLFGRVRALSQAALARYFASEEGYRTARISLVAAVADAYLAERLAREQTDLAEQTLEDWRQSLRLARLLKQARQSGELEVVQAESQVATAEADLEARQRERLRAQNALRLLVGVGPSDLPDGLPLDQQPVMTQLPAGLPSDLLTHRPDIRRAEQLMRAANADIGAARAAFFPRLSLTASFGYASPAMGNLFDGQQRVWSFSPQITQPLFQHGRLRAERRLSEVRKSSAVADYERTIQVAFREVADGLAGRETFSRQIEAQRRVVAGATRRVELSTLRYRSGVDSRLELLDAQRQLYAARQTLLDLRRGEFSNAVALYKALGGGLSDAAR